MVRRTRWMYSRRAAILSIGSVLVLCGATSKLLFGQEAPKQPVVANDALAEEADWLAPKMLRTVGEVYQVKFTPEDEEAISARYLDIRLGDYDKFLEEKK